MKCQLCQTNLVKDWEYCCKKCFKEDGDKTTALPNSSDDTISIVMDSCDRVYERYLNLINPTVSPREKFLDWKLHGTLKCTFVINIEKYDTTYLPQCLHEIFQEICAKFGSTSPMIDTELIDKGNKYVATFHHEGKHVPITFIVR